MIETTFGKTYQKICIDPVLRLKCFRRVHPIQLTGFSCITGVCVLPLLLLKLTFFALLLLTLSGFLDTLDGALARQEGKTSNLGAAIDILSDRVVEFAVILGLMLIDPASRAISCHLMLGSVFLCVTTFMIVGIFTKNDSKKGFHYSSGLIERAEAFVFFAAMIALPSEFLLLSSVFSGLVLVTAFMRMFHFAMQNISNNSQT